MYMQGPLSRHAVQDRATVPRTVSNAPAFVVTANGTPQEFGIDEDAFTDWLAVESEELERNLPAKGHEAPGRALAELVHWALSAAVLMGDPNIELNVHGCVADATGYVMRLNNRTGHQRPVGLTRGRHEVRWPPSDLTLGEKIYCYLQQICDIANALLKDLPSTTRAIASGCACTPVEGWPRS